jgi:hypothetical protein
MRRRFLALGASVIALTLGGVGTATASVDQTNAAPATAVASNDNSATQIAAGGGSASQSSSGTQVVPVAAAPAVSAQVVPVNANVPVRVASPGDEGAVHQANAAPATAVASNDNSSTQVAGAGHPAKDPKGSKDPKTKGTTGDGGPGAGSVSQSSSRTQVLPIGLAPAVSAQVLPINANVPVRILSSGDDPAVHQANVAPAAALASNDDSSFQGVRLGAGGSSSQSSSGTQLLPVSLAPAVGLQVLPVNLNVPVHLFDDLALPKLPLVSSVTGVLADPVGAVTGTLADPVGTVTGLAGGLPLVDALPLGTVTGLVGSLPVAPLLGTATGVLGTLPLGALPLGVL